MTISFDERLKSSTSIRLLIVAGLTVALFVPLLLINALVYERQDRKDRAVREIGAKWGEPQTIVGPVLVVPYYDRSHDSLARKKEYARFLPEELHVNAALEPNTRSRGIYEAILYSAKSEFSGHFVAPDFSKLDLEPYRVLWNEAYVLVGMSDLRGVRDELTLSFDGENVPVDPTIGEQNIAREAVRADVTIDSRKKRLDFSFTLTLNGSETFMITPVGKTTRAAVESKWSDPAFTGAFLPDERNVRDDSFNAAWRVFHLNRSFPQQWTGESPYMTSSAFGVELLQTADSYQQISRAAKYSFLFIGLTFVAFFLVEVLYKSLLHPMHYLLVGVAIIVFYTLLLSLGEHLDFILAYGIASVATIALVVSYSWRLFTTEKARYSLAGSLVALYVFLLVVLRLETYSLLLGSVFLFIIIAAVMMATRKIDWYALGASTKKTNGDAPKKPDEGGDKPTT
ncbi:MAG: cell envelope integrity protein CreD [Ignavibacteriales bacterium]|nr:cell envelope integrity protein CreD [Ignavibacteriales bacterium]